MSSQELFDAAVAVVRALPAKGSMQPTDEQKLAFYGYFKQVTEGPCNKPSPGMFDFTGKAKWGAWNKLGDLSKEEAQKKYAEELNKVLTANPADAEGELGEKIEVFNKLMSS